MSITATELPVNRIKHQDVTMLQLTTLEPHPSNRPLGKSREKIDQLKESIQQHGFFASQPITVRPVNGKYQIIKGEHRYLAAQELSFDELPCVIEELTDEEALIQLIVGNIQTENKPLEIGLNALEVVKKDSKKGYSAANYATKVGLNERNVQDYINSASVFKHIEQSETGFGLLYETTKLKEIFRCHESDWLWLHETIVENELSKTQTDLLCKSIKDLSNAITLPETAELFDIPKLKQEIAKESINNKDKTLSITKGAIKLFEENFNNLEEITEFHTYDLDTDQINTEEVSPRDIFVDKLREKEINKTSISSVLKEILTLNKQHTKQAAESDAEYYRAENNSWELKEHRRIEKEQSDYAFDSWLACQTTAEIATQLSIDRAKVKTIIETEKPIRSFDDDSFIDNDSFMIYNLWSFNNNKSYGTDGYPGRIPGQIVENLLYYHTKPYDKIIDPMAGGGTTIDVCKTMTRRYLAFDIKPSREDIIQNDLTTGFPDNCKDANLIFLDPPYWSQKKCDYSDHPTNLANLTLDDFYESLEKIFINAHAILAPGGLIALIIGPTQENNKVIDHASDIYAILKKNFNFVNRYTVPYTTQQIKPFHIADAKKARFALKIVRDLLVFQKE